MKEREREKNGDLKRNKMVKRERERLLFQSNVPSEEGHPEGQGEGERVLGVI